MSMKSSQQSRPAFTMVEFLVALVVLGVLLAVMLPVLRIFVENKNARMLEKAYYNVESIVAALKSDNVSYPDCSTSNADPACGSAVVGGFQNTLVKQSNGTYTATDAKFANLFAAKLNALGYNPAACTSTLCIATTPDGMTWDLKNLVAAKNNWATAPYIDIDVNGAGAPNCRAIEEGCTTPDQIRVRIESSGRTIISNDPAAPARPMPVCENGTPITSSTWCNSGGFFITNCVMKPNCAYGVSAQYPSGGDCWQAAKDDCALIGGHVPRGGVTTQIRCTYGDPTFGCPTYVEARYLIMSCTNSNMYNTPVWLEETYNNEKAHYMYVGPVPDSGPWMGDLSLSNIDTTNKNDSNITLRCIKN